MYSQQVGCEKAPLNTVDLFGEESKVPPCTLPMSPGWSHGPSGVQRDGGPLPEALLSASYPGLGPSLDSELWIPEAFEVSLEAPASSGLCNAPTSLSRWALGSGL